MQLQEDESWRKTKEGLLVASSSTTTAPPTAEGDNKMEVDEAPPPPAQPTQLAEKLSAIKEDIKQTQAMDAIYKGVRDDAAGPTTAPPPPRTRPSSAKSACTSRLSSSSTSRSRSSTTPPRRGRSRKRAPRSQRRRSPPPRRAAPLGQPQVFLPPSYAPEPQFTGAQKKKTRRQPCWRRYTLDDIEVIDTRAFDVDRLTYAFAHYYCIDTNYELRIRAKLATAKVLHMTDALVDQTVLLARPDREAQRPLPRSRRRADARTTAAAATRQGESEQLEEAALLSRPAEPTRPPGTSCTSGPALAERSDRDGRAPSPVLGVASAPLRRAEGIGEEHLRAAAPREASQGDPRRQLSEVDISFLGGAHVAHGDCRRSHDGAPRSSHSGASPQHCDGDRPSAGTELPADAGHASEHESRRVSLRPIEIGDVLDVASNAADEATASAHLKLRPLRTPRRYGLGASKISSVGLAPLSQCPDPTCTGPFIVVAGCSFTASAPPSFLSLCLSLLDFFRARCSPRIGGRANSN